MQPTLCCCHGPPLEDNGAAPQMDLSVDSTLAPPKSCGIRALRIHVFGICTPCKAKLTSKATQALRLLFHQKWPQVKLLVSAIYSSYTYRGGTPRISMCDQLKPLVKANKVVMMRWIQLKKQTTATINGRQSVDFFPPSQHREEAIQFQVVFDATRITRSESS